MGSEMRVNIFSIFSIEKDRSDLFPADVVMLCDIISFHLGQIICNSEYWVSYYLYMHHPLDSIAHTMAFVNPVMVYQLEWEIAQWVQNGHPTQHEQILYHWATSRSFL